jgi:hypothetical protein
MACACARCKLGPRSVVARGVCPVTHERLSDCARLPRMPRTVDACAWHARHHSHASHACAACTHSALNAHTHAAALLASPYAVSIHAPPPRAPEGPASPHALQSLPWAALAMSLDRQTDTQTETHTHSLVSLTPHTTDNATAMCESNRQHQHQHQQGVRCALRLPCSQEA